MQNIYAWIYERMLQLAIYQITGSIGSCVEFWAVEKVVSAQGRNANKLEQAIAKGENFLPLDSKWFHN